MQLNISCFPQELRALAKHVRNLSAGRNSLAEVTQETEPQQVKGVCNRTKLCGKKIRRKKVCVGKNFGGKKFAGKKFAWVKILWGKSFRASCLRSIAFPDRIWGAKLTRVLFQTELNMFVLNKLRVL